jgi:hypothetical protein
LTPQDAFATLSYHSTQFFTTPLRPMSRRTGQPPHG